MLETQARRLNRSRLLHSKVLEPCLALEPLSLKEKHLAKLRAGDWIDLGEHLPRLQIRRAGRRVAEVRCEGSECFVSRLCDGEAEIPERKRVLVESRIAVVPESEVREGGRLELPDPVLEQILLFVGEEPLAIARLVRGGNGHYALEIRERIDG
ncbi:hypothetical protein [Nitratifractor salsuginis]|uniref:Uncharacterized protein n=1 Tax=Nitratifractor salsuginis (strain DSM 16511 / JCM 12458 / E9I37-1) TaxID=749222 RepID=E6WZ83_NITSE|nr:hypothetical protein [Nitratifractor salsuginis]ADV46595.1 hypothetical protein Nitsa_1344 [Nitratifractor salsuginis DSM 16511]